MGVRYSSLAKVATQAEGVRTQNGRFLHEALDHRQANCVDGSMLLASVLAHLGYETSLVSFPNHCLVCVTLVKGKPMMIEMTVLSTKADLGNAIDLAGRRGEKMASRFGKVEGYYVVEVNTTRALGVLALRSRRGTR